MLGQSSLGFPQGQGTGPDFLPFPDPHPAGQRPPGSPRVLLTRAGGHTAELSLQLGTLAGLAAVLGGHAGPHPAPGPPPAAAGAQAPGPPLLPHAVHCKEARGRWLGGTLAPPTAHPPTNQELRQLCHRSSLDLPWAPGFRPLWGVGMWKTQTSSPNSHRTLPVDTRTGRLESTQEGSQGSSSPGGTGKPRKGLKIYPILPHPHPSPPQIQSKNPTWQAWGKRMPLPTPSTGTHK